MESEKLKKKSKIQSFLRKPRLSNEKWLRNRLAVFLFFLVLLSIGFLSVKTTSSSRFCSSCHEMAPQHYTWRASSHAEVSCVSCHTGVSLGEMVQAKASVFTRTARKISGQYQPPIQIASSIPDSSCERCHDMRGRDVSPSGDLIIPHSEHMDRKVKCVSCHSGVAHGKVSERNITFMSDLDRWDDKMGEYFMSDSLYTNAPMDKCMSCHETRNITRECGACHTTGMYPDSHKEKDFLTRQHGQLAYIELQDCHFCHKWDNKEEITMFDERYEYLNFLDNSETDERVVTRDYIAANDFCRDCHSQAPLNHDEQFPVTHGEFAKQSEETCLACHDQARTRVQRVAQTTCGECHPSVHAGYDLRQHPRTTGEVVTIKESCYSCHPRETCQSCHRVSK